MSFSEALAAAYAVDVPRDVARRAVDNLRSGLVQLAGFSGWLGSGKDFIAPQVLAALGVPAPQHLYYSLPLKTEVNEVLHLATAVRTIADVQSGVHDIAETMGVPVEQAAVVLGMLWIPTRDPRHTLTSRTRTPEIRAALQYWGTEVRRRQDVDYWVKLALRPALEALAAGVSVMVTDVRFPNEVAAVQTLGGFAGRLDVSRETQRARILARDGILPDDATLYHASETALDDYAGFDARVDNNGAAADTVTALVAALREHTAQLQRATTGTVEFATV